MTYDSIFKYYTSFATNTKPNPQKVSLPHQIFLYIMPSNTFWYWMKNSNWNEQAESVQVMGLFLFQKQLVNFTIYSLVPGEATKLSLFTSGRGVKQQSWVCFASQNQRCSLFLPRGMKQWSSVRFVKWTQICCFAPPPPPVSTNSANLLWSTKTHEETNTRGFQLLPSEKWSWYHLASARFAADNNAVL